MNLPQELNNIAFNYHAHYFGIADLKKAHDFIIDQGGDILSHHPSSISIGITLPHDIVDLLPKRSEVSVRISYRHFAYDVINERLDHTISVLSSYVQKAGYRSLPIPASRIVDSERICGSFSHKLGAHLAGLGWIGKSCLLVTPRDGPRVRWASILTDAPLKPTGDEIEQQCGDCSACVDICPVKAFTGRAFCPEEPRSFRFDASKCYQYFESMKIESPPDVCGLCLYICPKGLSNRRIVEL